MHCRPPTYVGRCAWACFLLSGVVVLEGVTAKETPAPTASPLPRRVDWRMSGFVGPVISDLYTGCAEAAPANAVATAVGAQRSVLYRKPFEAVSTQETLNCVFASCTPNREAYLDVRRVYEWYLAHTGGNVTSAAWLPYVPQPFAPACNLTGAPTAARIDGYRSIPRLDEAAMARVVAERGPIVVALNAVPLEAYTGGVFNASDCVYSARHVDSASLRRRTSLVRPAHAAEAVASRLADGAQQLDYVASVVGYDLAAPVPYWILRFTFGEDYGEGGYVYLEYGKNACLVAEQATYPTVADT